MGILYRNTYMLLTEMYEHIQNEKSEFPYIVFKSVDHIFKYNVTDVYS